MEIPITIDGKPFFITSDQNQYMISEERVRDGKTTLEGRWFYQSLGVLFVGLLHKKVRACDVRSLEELRDEIYRAEHEIMRAFDFEKVGEGMAGKIEEKMTV